jgi:hypothetical protein
VVEPCSGCGEPLVASYPGCPSCLEALERHWLADWAALLEGEGVAPGTEDERLLAAVVHAEIDRQPWTLVDVALTLLRCEACGGELGGGPRACPACELAFGNLWAHDVVAGQQGVMTMNEHALRVGRHVLRHPHRYSPATLTGWRLTMPRVLTGWLPSTAQAQCWGDLIKAGRLAEVERGLEEADVAIARRGARPG